MGLTSGVGVQGRGMKAVSFCEGMYSEWVGISEVKRIGLAHVMHRKKQD